MNEQTAVLPDLVKELERLLQWYEDRPGRPGHTAQAIYIADVLAKHYARSNEGTELPTSDEAFPPLTGCYSDAHLAWYNMIRDKYRRIEKANLALSDEVNRLRSAQSASGTTRPTDGRGLIDVRKAAEEDLERRRNAQGTERAFQADALLREARRWWDMYHTAFDDDPSWKALAAKIDDYCRGPCAVSASGTERPTKEGYPGIAHDLETMRRALQRIAITDDEDCAHARDAEAMKRIAREALRSVR